MIFSCDNTPECSLRSRLAYNVCVYDSAEFVLKVLPELIYRDLKHNSVGAYTDSIVMKMILTTIPFNKLAVRFMQLSTK